MAIQQIQSTSNSISFSGKVRYVTPNIRDGINVLLTRMNSEITTETNQYCTHSHFIHSLIHKNKAEFIDFRQIHKKISPEKQVVGKSGIKIGKTELVIDNKTGEIVEYYKPIFTFWKRVMKNVQKYVDIFLENYDNDKIVKKNFLCKRELTDLGIEAQSKMSKLI